MARPKRIPGTPTAKEAIVSSFWDLYAERPFEQISVKEVCERAEVNKTTFYYHFQDLQEVLGSIEDSCLPLEAPEMAAAALATGNVEAFIADFIKTMEERFERYCLLLSSKGDPDFATRARKIMVQRWCDELGLSYDDLPADTKMLIRFMIGGTSSIFADHGDGEAFDPDSFARVLSLVASTIVKSAEIAGCLKDAPKTDGQ